MVSIRVLDLIRRRRRTVLFSNGNAVSQLGNDSVFMQSLGERYDRHMTMVSRSQHRLSSAVCDVRWCTYSEGLTFRQYFCTV